MNPQRVGLFGGTFDPIHCGHLSVAEYAFKRLQLDHLIFIPSGTPPHKDGNGRTDSTHRYHMVCHAVAGDARFSVSAIEIERAGKSFTVDTVRQLSAAAEQGTLFYFILGDDCAANLHRWKGLDELMTMVEFVSVLRHGASADASIAQRVVQLDMPVMDISSSQLRARMAQGHALEDQLPQAVRQYIAEHRLYIAAREVA